MPADDQGPYEFVAVASRVLAPVVHARLVGAARFLCGGDGDVIRLVGLGAFIRRRCLGCSDVAIARAVRAAGDMARGPKARKRAEGE